MPTHYSEFYSLEVLDITQLLEIYRQAYFEKYPDQLISQLDERFWQNEAGELIYYAGEQALLDQEKEVLIQPLGRGLYDATLTLTARFLELDFAELPAENIHIISLINLDRGHWTSTVLSIEDVNPEKYKEIYQLYQQFKQFLKDHHPDFVMVRGEQGCTNFFVQYATGNRFGAVIRDRMNSELLIRVFFESIDKKELLDIKWKEGEENYTEGNLKVVLAPKNPKDIGLFHFDSLPSTETNDRVSRACERFLEANQLQFAHARNLAKQSGMTCGEHAILNPLRYVFFGLTNVVPSSHLREATNHFCVAFAKLFLFDYKPEMYQKEYARILHEQKLKEQEEIEKNLADQPALDVPTDKKDTTKKFDSGEFLENGIYIGIALTLVSVQVIAPMFLGIVNPLYAGIFAMAVGFVGAQIVKAFAPEVQEAITELKSSNIFAQKNDVSEEQKLLEKLSIKAFDIEYPNAVPNSPEPPKTFTPLLTTTTELVPTARVNSVVSQTPTPTLGNKTGMKV